MSENTKVKKSGFDKFLDTIERIGNKLPDPITMFLGLAVIVMVLSAVLSAIGFSAINPADGATVEHKIEKVAQKYPMVDKSKIRIVQREIESWYLAGLDKINCTKYKIKYLERTDEVSKEKFDSMIPKKLDHTSFQIEILKYFDKECAKSRNYSFDSFAS